MATAYEKLVAAMNQTSRYWEKTLEVQAQNGKVIFIRCDGFCFKSDLEKEVGDGDKSSRS